jgi:hypothetical protein
VVEPLRAAVDRIARGGTPLATVRRVAAGGSCPGAPAKPAI